MVRVALAVLAVGIPAAALADQAHVAPVAPGAPTAQRPGQPAPPNHSGRGRSPGYVQPIVVINGSAVATPKPHTTKNATAVSLPGQQIFSSSSTSTH